MNKPSINISTSGIERRFIEQRRQKKMSCCGLSGRKKMSRLGRLETSGGMNVSSSVSHPMKMLKMGVIMRKSKRDLEMESRTRETQKKW